jgi:hypothetical protein
MRIRLSAKTMVILFLLLFLTTAHAAQERIVEGYRIVTEMVPMRDGVKLATDIAFPKGEGGPYPALLMRTPYGRKGAIDGFVKGDGKRFLDDGYVLVAQDTRGRGDSEGENVAFLADGWIEHWDGYDTVEWLAKQRWCNGKIGTFGGSALGITQYALAGSAPPHLKAMHAWVACPDLYIYAIHQGGALRESLAVGWSKANKFNERTLDLFSYGRRIYDSFWKVRSLKSVIYRVNVPSVHVGGWFDIFSQGTLDAFVMMQHESAPGARGRQRLIMGPWPHGITRKVGEIEFPENAVETPNFDMKEWFDYWIKGIDTGIFAKPPVDYYVMGDVDDPEAPGNEWRTAQDWPIPCRYTPLYLREGGRLSFQKPLEENSSQTYTYDPKNPVPTKGGANLLIPAGSMDQRELEGRSDVLVFQTDPLEEPLQVIGRIRVKLWASSSCTDTDFVAKLMDVYPDGRSMLIADGIIRGRFRRSLSREELLEPGTIYEFEIDLWSTAIVFNRGHRIKVHITSSNYPRFDINPNTGEDYAEGCDMRVAENTIYHDKRHPSHLLLPIVPYSASSEDSGR